MRKVIRKFVIFDKAEKCYVTEDWGVTKDIFKAAKLETYNQAKIEIETHMFREDWPKFEIEEYEFTAYKRQRRVRGRRR